MYAAAIHKKFTVLLENIARKAERCGCIYGVAGGMLLLNGRGVKNGVWHFIKQLEFAAIALLDSAAMQIFFRTP